MLFARLSIVFYFHGVDAYSCYFFNFLSLIFSITGGSVLTGSYSPVSGRRHTAGWCRVRWRRRRCRWRSARFRFSSAFRPGGASAFYRAVRSVWRAHGHCDGYCGRARQSLRSSDGTSAASFASVDYGGPVFASTGGCLSVAAIGSAWWHARASRTGADGSSSAAAAAANDKRIRTEPRCSSATATVLLATPEPTANGSAPRPRSARRGRLRVCYAMECPVSDCDASTDCT